ncbi:MAG: PQQ-dependent sugar dehydrogenase [Rhodospirillales bacterium]|nr:PQQ-dependent sugar dehydrogenase [Rhodospirillales bacterium]
MRLVSLFVAALMVANAGTVFPAAKAQDDGVRNLLQTIKLPPGFKISLFARVPGARSIAVGPERGIVFVGSRGSTIHAILDSNKDGIADDVRLLTDRARVPNGIAVHRGRLYIAEQHRISVWSGLAERNFAQSNRAFFEVKAGLPDKGHHGWRYMAFGPDDKLYVSIGSPCNVCFVQGLEGKIIRMDANGQNLEVVASGIRNSVGFDWHPKTGELFFTDNGADGMGDDQPPDELNHVTENGQFFGFPYYGGGGARTPQTRGEQVPANAVPPVIEFQAHTASLGVHFYRGDMFPAEYRNDAFVAQHGSWNRSSRVGYRIMRIRFDNQGRAVKKELFADGWLKNESRWGRPVDIKMLADGSLLISDDFTGSIYRVTYGGS